MSGANLVVPGARAVSAAELAELAASLAGESPLEPFSDEIVSFCSALSTALLRSEETRPFPEIKALAFWMRRAELHRLRAEFAALATERTLVVPRGLVFHLPPSNVDTIFVYSWLLSVLVGNRNVVRLSAKGSPQTVAICTVLNRVIERSEAAAVRGGTLMVAYGHEEEITRTLSAAADVRVIWGGDATVSAIRSVPLPPHAQELTFGDRRSLAALRASAFLALSPAAADALAERFYVDAYWFDQMGCSSPRVVIWCGGEAEASRASERFFAGLDRVVQSRGYSVDTGVAMAKRTFAYRSILDEPASGYRAWGNEIARVSLDGASELPRAHCGAGLFFQLRVDTLTDLVPLVRRHDQTLTHFGFELGELREFARSMNGRGIDRIVPMGQALTFNRYWDGHDLLQALTRRVYVEPDRVAPATPEHSHSGAP